ncbi:uncharacterized protein HD556DRAFT_1232074 [Suillus plorans]|uniref:Pyridoxamine 5'-phosphate oxidase N-terminal domain-containing protein n=1 Tax=Suillus plorans TaxID=116603 RepID=A0A9P7J220_9AGAM|nr:uncharacterized protein HD556DRAFT_1232074 [Suillus plorans]KAG1798909.1 hypothetical protein HD556DRAFT_1232074 [Suillus plorans]
MAKFYDEIPESLIEWIKKQHMFWVASAPLSPDGHINLSPKGTADSFHVVNSRRVWYQDLTGSGVETISHIRENGRVTILFSAFEGPPRILRLFGTGTVYEFGTEEYEYLISPETRKPGSRAAIVIDVYQCQTTCGFAVPIYDFVTHRTQLLRMADMDESRNCVSSTVSSSETDKKGIKARWARNNLRSIDGLPGLLVAPDSKVTPVNNFNKESQRPKLRYSSSREGSSQSSGANVAIGFALGALVATAIPYILSVTRNLVMHLFLLRDGRLKVKSGLSHLFYWNTSQRLIGSPHSPLVRSSKRMIIPMAKYYDEIPESLIEWVRKQHMFWVASAPLGPGGHVNVSPKGTAECFHVVNSHRVWYEDLTGSGVETISHIRENGRITILFHSFEGPPRILRLYGTGTVYEYGTQEYESLIPPETRKPGSRAAIVIDVYQCLTSCGYAVPIYDFVTHRTQLLRSFDIKESHDRATVSTEINPKGLRAYWMRQNLSSVDGLPGLLTAPESKATCSSVFDKGPRPKLHRLSSRDAGVLGTGATLAIGCAIGALVATALPRILSVTGNFGTRT